MKKPITISLISIIILASVSFSQNTKIDSLLGKLKTTKYDTNKVNILNVLSWELKFSYPDSAINYAKQALKIAFKNDFKNGVSIAYNNLGAINWIQGIYDKAIKYYYKSLKISEEIGDKKGIAYSYSNIGIIHKEQGNYAQAIKYYEKSLKILEEIGDKKGIAYCYNNIGVISYEQGYSASTKEVSADKYNKALKYYYKSLKIKEELASSPDEAIAKSGKQGIAMCYNNIGLVNKEQGNDNRALEYYHKSLKIYKKLGNKQRIALALGNIANLNNKQENFHKAIEYAEKSLNLAREIGALLREKDAYDNLSTAYKGLNNYKKSLEYYKLYSEAKDSLFTEKSNKQIIEMTTKYETEKKEKKIELLNKDKVMKQAEINKQKLLRNSFIIGFGLILLLAFVIFRGYRIKHKSNKLLAQQKEELKKLSIVAQKTDNAIMIMDPEGNFEWINEGLTKMYGFTLKQLIDTKGRNIIDSSTNPNIKEIINSCVKDKKTIIYESSTRAKSGKKMWAQATITPILDDKQNVIKLIAIDSDVTKIKEAEEKIQAQSNLLAQTNKDLEKKNISITDSINYAQRIQQAILPSEKLIKTYFPDSFIFFKPRDIVSGDFCWLSEQNNKLFIAVVDCTGHGVPGAFMSIIGNTLLNEIVNEKKIYTPSMILEELNTGVINTLKQDTNNKFSQDDGMDISLCCIDKNNKKIQIACANQLVYVINNDKIKLIEGDIFSIGSKVLSKKQKPDFTNHIIDIEKAHPVGKDIGETTIYMFSDGYLDQFGGDENKKFMTSRFEKMLFENHYLEMHEQLNIVSSTYENWKKNNKQIDDVLVVGIRI